MELPQNQFLDVYHKLLFRAIAFGDLEDYEEELTASFLYTFEQELTNIANRQYLTPDDKNNLLMVIHYVRFKKQFPDETVKKIYYEWCNEQIGKINAAEGNHSFDYWNLEFENHDYYYAGPTSKYVDTLLYYLPLLRAQLTDDFCTWKYLNDQAFYKNYFGDFVKYTCLDRTVSYFLKKYPEILTPKVCNQLQEVFTARYHILNYLQKADILDYEVKLLDTDEILNFEFDLNELQNLIQYTSLNDIVYYVNELETFKNKSKDSIQKQKRKS